MGEGTPRLPGEAERTHNMTARECMDGDVAARMQELWLKTKAA